MSAIGWQGRLNEASTTDDVAVVCGAFLASMTPVALADLPAACQPKEHLEVQDISPYALSLIRQLGIGDRSSAPALHEVTTFFTKAALRLAQITNQIAEVTAEQRRSRSS